MINEAFMTMRYDTVRLKFNEFKRQWKKAGHYFKPGNVFDIDYRYTGRLVNGKPHGYGILSFIHGNYAYRTTYKGRWKNGRFHGRGVYETMFSSHTVRHSGFFKDGLKHGYGKLSTMNGVTRGFWKNDELQEKTNAGKNIEKD